MNQSPPPSHRGPKDFDTVSGKRDEEEQEKAQTEEPAITEPEQRCGQRNSGNIVSQVRRVFTIPRPPILQRSPIMKASRIGSGSVF